MSGSVNKVILVGHLGRDPEARTFQTGGEVVTLRLATSESWKDRTTGERKEKTEWHTVAILNEALQKIAKSSLRKGSKIYVEGQIRTRKWQDNHGQDRWSTEIVLYPFGSQLVLLDKRERDPGREDYSAHQDEGRYADPGSGPDLDDDIPF